MCEGSPGLRPSTLQLDFAPSHSKNGVANCTSTGLEGLMQPACGGGPGQAGDRGVGWWVGFLRESSWWPRTAGRVVAASTSAGDSGQLSSAHLYAARSAFQAPKGRLVLLPSRLAPSPLGNSGRIPEV